MAAPWAVRMAALSVDCWAGRSELRWVAPMADRWVDGWAGCSADRSAAPWECNLAEKSVDRRVADWVARRADC